MFSRTISHQASFQRQSKLSAESQPGPQSAIDVISEVQEVEDSSIGLNSQHCARSNSAFEMPDRRISRSLSDLDKISNNMIDSKKGGEDYSNQNAAKINLSQYLPMVDLGYLRSCKTLQDKL